MNEKRRACAPYQFFGAPWTANGTGQNAAHSGGYIAHQAHEGPEQSVISSAARWIGRRSVIPCPLMSADTVPLRLGTAAPQAALISGLACGHPACGSADLALRHDLTARPPTLAMPQGTVRPAQAPACRRSAPGVCPYASGGRLRLLSRDGNDVTASYPGLGVLAGRVNVPVSLDGGDRRDPRRAPEFRTAAVPYARPPAVRPPAA